MAVLDTDNIIEQIAQIEGDLSNIATIEGDLNPISQIDGNIGNVIPVDISDNYKGKIVEEDWVLRGDGYWYYKVASTTHLLLNPYVNKFLVATSDGYDNAFYSYTVLANRDVRFRSSMPVNCEYNIAGER